jgi:hypothetical protein
LLVTKSFIIRRGDVNEATGQRLLGGSAGLVPGAGQLASAGEHLLDGLAGNPQLAADVSLGPAVGDEDLDQVAALGC